MGTYPTAPRSNFLDWCRTHAPVFTAHAADIGLTAPQAAMFQAAVTAAANADTSQAAAREAAKASTTEATLAFRTLRRSVAEMVRSIKTYAENSGDENAYVVAEIPPPATPGSVPPPGKPTGLAVTLDNATGAISLSWKASNPRGAQGTSYIVRRRVSPTTAFEFVGVSGSKKFTDNTFTAGPDSVQYTVQGQRADKAGPVSDIFTVTFGRVSPGVSQPAAAPRLAA